MNLRKWLKRGLMGAGAILLSLVVLAGLFYLRYMHVPSLPDYPPPADQAEAWRQDLDYLRKYPDHDWSFSDTDKKAFTPSSTNSTAIWRR
jgi:hypothetical protein